MRLLLVFALLAAMPLIPAADATHRCDRQPAPGQTVVYFPDDGCLGAWVDLGSRFHCNEGLYEETGTWTLAVTYTHGCRTALVVVIP